MKMTTSDLQGFTETNDCFRRVCVILTTADNALLQRDET